MSRSEHGKNFVFPGALIHVLTTKTNQLSWREEVVHVAIKAPFTFAPNKEGQDRCSSAQTALISVTVQSASSNLVTSRGQSSTLHKPATPLCPLWSLRAMNPSHHFFCVASFFRWNCFIWEETAESDGRCPGKVDVDPPNPYLWNLKKREVFCIFCDSHHRRQVDIVGRRQFYVGVLSQSFSGFLIDHATFHPAKLIVLIIYRAGFIIYISGLYRHFAGHLSSCWIQYSSHWIVSSLHWTSVIVLDYTPRHDCRGDLWLFTD